MQWGAESLASPGDDGAAEFALATCLSTICRELDVDLVTDWNTGLPETWGAVGHFKVGALACELIQDNWLKSVFMLNQSQIGLDDHSLEQGKTDYEGATFVPLADFADFVWRKSRKLDASNYFADMDQEAATGPYAGQTLLDVTRKQATSIPTFGTRSTRASAKTSAAPCRSGCGR